MRLRAPRLGGTRRAAPKSRRASPGPLPLSLPRLPLRHCRSPSGLTGERLRGPSSSRLRRGARGGMERGLQVHSSSLWGPPRPEGGSARARAPGDSRRSPTPKSIPSVSPADRWSGNRAEPGEEPGAGPPGDGARGGGAPAGVSERPTTKASQNRGEAPAGREARAREWKGCLRGRNPSSVAYARNFKIRDPLKSFGKFLETRRVTPSFIPW